MCTYIARTQKSGDRNSAQPQQPSTGVKSLIIEYFNIGFIVARKIWIKFDWETFQHMIREIYVFIFLIQDISLIFIVKIRSRPRTTLPTKGFLAVWVSEIWLSWVNVSIVGLLRSLYMHCNYPKGAFSIWCFSNFFIWPMNSDFWNTFLKC